jgi:hypothetical protein
MRSRTRCDRAGWHVHESGYVLLRTDGHGPRENWRRWEIASWHRLGGLTIDSSWLHPTLREAVAELEDEIARGARPETVEHPPFSPWPRVPAYPIVLDESRLDGTDANGVRWHYDDYLSEGDRVGTTVGGDVHAPFGTVVARADGRLVIELAPAATPEGPDAG